MHISVSGPSDAMDMAAKLYPNRMEQLGKNNQLVIELLTELGLHVEIDGTCYEKGCGPFCKMPVREYEGDHEGDHEDDHEGDHEDDHEDDHDEDDGEDEDDEEDW